MVYLKLLVSDFRVLEGALVVIPLRSPCTDVDTVFLDPLVLQ